MNNHSIPSTHTERKITACSHKHSFTPYPALSPYSQMDRITDGETNTLAVRGLEEIFPVVLLCQFFCCCGRKKIFRCYLPTIPVVPLCLVAQVNFLVVAGKSFRCYLLTNHTSCAIVSVFGFGGK